MGLLPQFYVAGVKTLIVDDLVVTVVRVAATAGFCSGRGFRLDGSLTCGWQYIRPILNVGLERRWSVLHTGCCHRGSWT
jgi:hypothetical protein